MVTAVVRGKGDWEVFVAKLWECWRGKAWEVTSENVGGTGSGLSSSSNSGLGPTGLYGSDGSVRMVGVAGILRREQEKWESTDKSMQEAFQDLNALMVLNLLFLFSFKFDNTFLCSVCFEIACLRIDCSWKF